MAWLQIIAAFVALSLLASATYLLNDLWDLPEDRSIGQKGTDPLRAASFRLLPVSR